MSVGKEITVTKVQVNKAEGGDSDTWRGYKHFNSTGFKLLKITHSDRDMTGGGLSDNMSSTFTNVEAVYIYYNHASDIDKPRVICIDKGGSDRKWYKAGTNADNWNKVTTGNLLTSNPDSVQDSELQTAAGSSSLTVTGTDYVIKLDKRSILADSGNAIKYMTGNDTNPSNRVITVEKKEGDQTANNPVPNGYVRYKHSPPATSPINGTIIYKHNGFPLKFTTDPPKTNVQAVYVYYHKDNDPNHEFPLIVCVDTGQDATRKYYKRGNTWKDISSTITYGPENSAVKQQLDNQFTPLISQYEVKLERAPGAGENTITYTARPKSPNDKITVDALSSGTTSYKGYRHPITNATDRVNRITIHGHITDGIDQDVLENFSFSTGGGVFVYFPLDKDSKPELKKPLLICLSKTGAASSTPGENKWYKRMNTPRPNKWTLETATDYNQIDPGQINAALEGKLTPIKNALTSANDKGYTKPVSLKIFIHINTLKLSMRT